MAPVAAARGGGGGCKLGQAAGFSKSCSKRVILFIEGGNLSANTEHSTGFRGISGGIRHVSNCVEAA